MLADAGLDGSETFVSRNYVEFKGVEEIDVTTGLKLFESIMQRDGWVKRWYEELRRVNPYFWLKSWGHDFLVGY